MNEEIKKSKKSKKYSLVEKIFGIIMVTSITFALGLGFVYLIKTLI